MIVIQQVTRNVQIISAGLQTFIDTQNRFLED
jgi:hypothetical protein